MLRIENESLPAEHPIRLEAQCELAAAYHADGRTELALTLIREVVKVRDRILKRKHPMRLGSLHQLAETYLSIGQVKEALDLSKEIVQTRDQTLPETHPDRLASRDFVGNRISIGWADREGGVAAGRGGQD